MAKAIEGPVQLGDLVKDKITGFQGVASSYTDFFHGCRRFGVQPQGVKKDGEGTHKAVSFDEPQLEILKRGLFKPNPITIADPLEMGDEVEDFVTQFRGIVVAIAVFPFAQRRIGVQPQHIKKEGEGIADDQWFDEPALLVKKKAKIARQAPKQAAVPGGPDKNPVRHNQPASRRSDARR